MTYYTGIDLGKNKVDISIIDSKGRIKAQGNIKADMFSILEFIKPYRKK